MKRLLSLILTGLLLLSAACTAAPKTQNAEGPTDPPAQTLKPTAWPFPSDEDLFVSDANASNTETTPDPDGSDQTGDITMPEISEGDLDLTDVSCDMSFAFALAARLLDGRQNRNLSPISVYLAMAMVTEGANGDTQAELLKMLGCETIEQLRGVCAALLEMLSIDSEHCTVDLKNSLWMADELGGVPVTFRDSFLSALGETYRSEANTVNFRDFTAGQQIAAWITEHTRGKIKISNDAMHFDPETIAVLINTIYLKANWVDPFDKQLQNVGVFYGPDGEESKVDYMTRSDHNVMIVQGDGWLRYRVQLSGIGWMTFVLPDEGIALDRLLGSSEAIETLLRAGINKTCNVSLMIPKFSFQDKMQLEAVLASMGLDLSFTDDADFSGMTDVPAKIDSVLQESFIGVDENGVEAAAYTMVSVKAAGIYNPVELETVEFHLTRPFLYAIESYDGTVLFIGTVTAPNAPETAHK